MITEDFSALSLLRENSSFDGFAVFPSERITDCQVEGNKVKFFELMPVFSEECDLIRTAGLDEMVHRLRSIDNLILCDENRPNVGKLN